LQWKDKRFLPKLLLQKLLQNSRHPQLLKQHNSKIQRKDNAPNRTRLWKRKTQDRSLHQQKIQGKAKLAVKDLVERKGAVAGALQHLRKLQLQDSK